MIRRMENTQKVETPFNKVLICIGTMSPEQRQQVFGRVFENGNIASLSNQKELAEQVLEREFTTDQWVAFVSGVAVGIFGECIKNEDAACQNT